MSSRHYSSSGFRYPFESFDVRCAHTFFDPAGIEHGIALEVVMVAVQYPLHGTSQTYRPKPAPWPVPKRVRQEGRATY